MTDRPIIFSGPMVRALFDDRKTMTRRLLKPYEPKPGIKAVPRGLVIPRVGGGTYFPPRFVIGDLLWVRETWQIVRGRHKDAVLYRADSMWPMWRSPIHMPRWASRLTLEVIAVKIERLQKISEEDARAEGATYHDGGEIGHSGWRHDWKDVHADARSSFARFWRELHGKDSWDANPWVVVPTFKVHKCNIDEFQREVVAA